MFKRFVVSTACVVLFPLMASAADWEITMWHSDWSAGRFKVTAVVENTSGMTLYDCVCSLTVSDNATVEMPADADYSMGDMANGESFRCVFTVYDPHERETSYEVNVGGRTSPRPSH